MDNNKTDDTNDQTVPADSATDATPVVAEAAAGETPAAEEPEAPKAEPEATAEPEAPAEEAQAPVAEPEAPKVEAQAETTPAGATAPAGTDQQGRQLFNAKCTTCGKDIQVPFQPSEGRPVYCREDYMKMRGGQ